MVSTHCVQEDQKDFINRFRELIFIVNARFIQVEKEENVDAYEIPEIRDDYFRISMERIAQFTHPVGQEFEVGVHIERVERLIEVR